LSQFLREPVLHARPLIRIGVVGAVAKPGFYAVPADVVLSDALMATGGRGPGAKRADLRIERAGERRGAGAAPRQAISAGLLPAGGRCVRAGIPSPAPRALAGHGGFALLVRHAAQVDVRFSVADPVRDGDVNLLGLLNLLEGARTGGVRRVIFASSGGAIYVA